MSTVSDDRGEKDLLNRSFMDPIFLQQFALTRENALEYFCRSPFYDISSNNETLRMQGTSMSHVHLQRMTGIEFALGEDRGSREGSRGNDGSSDGRLFLVKKQRRDSPTSVHVLSVYYILDGTVYQSPNLLHLMMTKYNKIASCLSAALSLNTDCVDYKHPDNDGAGLRRAFPVQHRAAQREGERDLMLSESGKKRQKITDCRDFPSFNNCVSDMLTFVNKGQ